MSKLMRVTVYQSYEYEIEVTDQEATQFKEDSYKAYQLICDCDYEPLEFSTDEVTVEVIC